MTKATKRQRDIETMRERLVLMRKKAAEENRVLRTELRRAEVAERRMAKALVLGEAEALASRLRRLIVAAAGTPAYERANAFVEELTALVEVQRRGRKLSVNNAARQLAPVAGDEDRVVMDKNAK